MVQSMNDLRSRITPLIAQGVAAQNAQRYPEAERAYRAALQIDPTDPRALALLGTLAGIAGQFQLAIDLFTRALQRDPANADLYHNIGETYRQLGDTGKALPAFNRAIELRPAHHEAYRSAADAAIAAAERADNANAGEHARELRRIAARYLLNLGNKLSSDTTAVAEPTFREAVDLDPGNAGALFALGSLLQPIFPTEAVAVLRRAIVLDPKMPEAHNNLGNTFFNLQRWQEAEDALSTALALNPNSVLAHQNLASIRHMRWLYEDTATAQEVFEKHRAWGKQVVDEVSAATISNPPFANSRDPDRKIRVAFLSGDFRGHSVAYFFRPLLRHLDPAAVDIFCYSEIDRPDAVTESLRQLGGKWRDTVKMSDAALREQLRADAIDIVVDLAGHTARNRLRALAVKAAPVTATWLGYPATTGLPAIDWRITDAVVDPPGAERIDNRVGNAPVDGGKARRRRIAQPGRGHGRRLHRKRAQAVSRRMPGQINHDIDGGRIKMTQKRPEKIRHRMTAKIARQKGDPNPPLWIARIGKGRIGYGGSANFVHHLFPPGAMFFEHLLCRGCIFIEPSHMSNGRKILMRQRRIGVER